MVKNAGCGNVNCFGGPSELDLGQLKMVGMRSCGSSGGAAQAKDDRVP